MTPRRAGRPPDAESPHGREALLAAARELLAEQGLARVSLRDVARRAGVQPPLVHYHFGSKRELFEAVVVELSERLRAQLASAARERGSPEQRLRAYLSHVIHTLAAQPYAAQLLAELVLFPDDEHSGRFLRDFGAPNLAVLEGVLRDGERDGSFRALELADAAPAVMGLCVFYFLSAPALRRLLSVDPLEPEAVDRYAAAAADLLLDGLRAGGRA